MYLTLKNIQMLTETILSLFLGVGLAASVGFRVFVPLFALSLAAHFNVIPLNESWQWLGSYIALFTLGIATIAEVLAYYIPWFDNLLDTLAIPLATVAGTLIMVSTAVDLSPVVTWAIAIIAGGGTAAAVKTTTSSTRLASTATTGGIANPVISTVETGTATVMSVFSIFLPVLAIILVIGIFFLIRKLYRKLFQRKK